MNINVRKILSLYETGETERAFLMNKNPKIESYLLESEIAVDTELHGLRSSYCPFTTSFTFLCWNFCNSSGNKINPN